MMLEEIHTFEIALKQSLTRSKHINVNICSKEESSNLIKQINELQEICNQATESTDSLKSDVQSLRLTLYEALAMSAEAQSKVEALNNPK